MGVVLMWAWLLREKVNLKKQKESEVIKVKQEEVGRRVT